MLSISTSADIHSSEAAGCRSCGTPLRDVFADLGTTPISNAFLRPEEIGRPEPTFPLKALVCRNCFLVQAIDAVPREGHFHGNYAYFSSISAGWVEHARHFVERSIERYALTIDSFVVEVASNDGYLLRHFVDRGVPCLGVDPAANCAEAAAEQGVRTEVAFFGRSVAETIALRERRADLVVANNVLAHVPDISDFVAGFTALLAPGGTASLEFPHLLRLIERNQFDTIYHEHYSYLSLIAIEPLLARHGLEAADVEEIETHGGSLRLMVRHAGHEVEPTRALERVRGAEHAAGLDRIETYLGFGAKVGVTRQKLRNLLRGLKADGKRIAGYGAPAKGNTLLNYCGIGKDMLDYTVDMSPAKQGLVLPGTHIPILSPEHLLSDKPDYVLILPWNLRDEIMTQMAAVRSWGGRFIVPIPEPEILP